MAARSHLFPFRTEKLSSLSPMVLNFGRVGSRRFQESISLRLTPFFVRVRAQKPAAGLGQPSSTGSCPPGDNRLRPSRDGVSPSATGCPRQPFFINHQSLFPRQLPAPQATIGDGRPWTMCHLRRRKNPQSSTIHPQPSIFPFYFLFL